MYNTRNCLTWKSKINITATYIKKSFNFLEFLNDGKIIQMVLDGTLKKLCIHCFFLDQCSYVHRRGIFSMNIMYWIVSLIEANDAYIICCIKRAMIGSDNECSLFMYQDIIENNADILLITPFGTKLCDIWRSNTFHTG